MKLYHDRNHICLYSLVSLDQRSRKNINSRKQSMVKNIKKWVDDQTQSPSQLNGTVSPEKVSPCSTTFLHCQEGHVIDTNIGTVKSLRLVAVLDQATRRYNLMPRDVRSSGLCRPGAFS